MATRKATTEEQLTALCKPLDLLLQDFSFAPTEVLTGNDTYMTTHRRGVDTIETLVGAIEELRFLDLEMAYLAGSRKNILYRGTHSGGDLLEMHGLEVIHASIRDALGNWSANYRFTAKTPLSLLSVAERITAAYQKEAAVNFRPELSEGATTEGAKLEFSRPYVRAVMAGTRHFAFLDEGNHYFRVLAENYDLTRGFEVRVTEPCYAPKDMAFAKMNAAVKQVITALSS